MIRRLIAPFALVLAIAACTAPVGQLTVVSYSPVDGATDVALDTVVTATFNRNVAADSLDGNFTLSDDGTAVAGEVSWDLASLTATFTPDEPLAYDTTYTATLSGDIATPNDLTISGTVSWTFTTIEDPTVDPGAITAADYEDLVVLIDGDVDLTANASGGEGSLSFELADGSELPAGLTLNADGSITGTPTEDGLFEGTVVVSDEGDQSADLDYSITVWPLLVVDGNYAPYAGDASIDTTIDIAFPTITNAYGDVTFTLISGNLPAPFVTTEVLDGDDVVHPGGTAEVGLTAEGAITGNTGYFGVFTGTVEVEDELGQTATAEFVLDLDLLIAYTGELTIPVSQDAGEIVVNGDRVRVSGVPTEALPEDIVLLFTLTIDPGDSSTDADGETPAQDDYTINETDGTITKVTAISSETATWNWAYDVVAQEAEFLGEDDFPTAIDGGKESNTVRFNFTRNP